MSEVVATEKQKAKAEQIAYIYSLLGVKNAELIGVKSGENATWYDFQVKNEKDLKKVEKYRDDVSLFLSVPRVNLVCPIPEKTAFSIEIPK